MQKFLAFLLLFSYIGVNAMQKKNKNHLFEVMELGTEDRNKIINQQVNFLEEDETDQLLLEENHNRQKKVCVSASKKHQSLKRHIVDLNKIILN